MKGMYTKGKTAETQGEQDFWAVFWSYECAECVKMQIGLLAETPGTWSLLGRGTWPQLMCCALVVVRVPEVGRGWVGALEQGGSSDDDQDSEQ